MWSKKIRTGPKGHIRVWWFKQPDGAKLGLLAVRNWSGTDDAFTWVTTKKLRDFSKACSQIADEIDTSKE